MHSYATAPLKVDLFSMVFGESVLNPHSFIIVV